MNTCQSWAFMELNGTKSNSTIFGGVEQNILLHGIGQTFFLALCFVILFALCIGYGLKNSFIRKRGITPFLQIFFRFVTSISFLLWVVMPFQGFGVITICYVFTLLTYPSIMMSYILYILHFVRHIWLILMERFKRSYFDRLEKRESDVDLHEMSGSHPQVIRGASANSTSGLVSLKEIQTTEPPVDTTISNRNSFAAGTSSEAQESCTNPLTTTSASINNASSCSIDKIEQQVDIRQCEAGPPSHSSFIQHPIQQTAYTKQRKPLVWTKNRDDFMSCCNILCSPCVICFVVLWLSFLWIFIAVVMIGYGLLFLVPEGREPCTVFINSFASNTFMIVSFVAQFIFMMLLVFDFLYHLIQHLQSGLACRNISNIGGWFLVNFFFMGDPMGLRLECYALMLSNLIYVILSIIFISRISPFAALATINQIVFLQITNTLANPGIMVILAIYETSRKYISSKRQRQLNINGYRDELLFTSSVSPDTLDLILVSNPIVRKYFKQYCVTETSSENFECWCLLTRYKQSKSYATRWLLMKKFFKIFAPTGSPMEVGMPKSMKDNLIKNYKMIQEIVSKGGKTSDEYDTAVHKSFFEYLEKHILLTMKDTYSRLHIYHYEFIKYRESLKNSTSQSR